MTVSEQIIQVLDALCEKFGLAIDWTSENVIPYLATLCEKLIAYEIWTSVFWIGIVTALSIASAIATKKLTPIFKKGIENQGRYDDGWSIGAAFAIGGLIFVYSCTFIVIAVQAKDIIKCIIFPELYVVEYIKSIMK